MDEVINEIDVLIALYGLKVSYKSTDVRGVIIANKYGIRVWCGMQDISVTINVRDLTTGKLKQPWRHRMYPKHKVIPKFKEIVISLLEETNDDK